MAECLFIKADEVVKMLGVSQYSSVHRSKPYFGTSDNVILKPAR